MAMESKFICLSHYSKYTVSNVTMVCKENCLETTCALTGHK